MEKIRLNTNIPMSPTRNAFGNRVPKQIQRCLPLYIAVLIFFLLMLNLDLFGSTATILPRSHIRKSAARFPSSKQFPRKIWQTWKMDVFSFDERDMYRARTWTTSNPGYRYEVLTDNNDVYYVETHFGPEGLNRPDIVEMYTSLNDRIIKADLIRYLVMYVEGGVYADIDVEDLKPVNRWIPKRFEEEDLDMVIGVEIDEPEFAMHPILGQKSKSFCQWTFMSKPGNPLMLRLVDNILKWLNGIAQAQGKPISDITLGFDDVLTGTGPSAFTSAALAEMSSRMGRTVEWSTFHSLDEAVNVGGILVLNVEAFAAGQGHSDSGNHDSRFALVRHRYHASGWPSSHPRVNHPAYGEVELCNWNTECVALWDVNTAAYESLSESDKAKLIEIKKVEDAVRNEASQRSDAFFRALERQDAEKRKNPFGVQRPMMAFPAVAPAPEAVVPATIPDMRQMPHAEPVPLPEARPNTHPLAPATSPDMEKIRPAEPVPVPEAKLNVQPGVRLDDYAGL